MDNKMISKGDGECLIQYHIEKNNVQCSFNCIGLNCKHDNLDDNDYFCLNFRFFLKVSLNRILKFFILLIR